MFFRIGIRLLLVQLLLHAVMINCCQDAELEQCVTDPNANMLLDQHAVLPYRLKSDQYPSLNMERYTFIRNFYSLLRFLFDCYFTLVDAVFNLLNAFEPAQHVGWNNASELLFIPAHKAAKMIREDSLTSTELISAYIDRLKEEAKSVDAELAKMTAAKRKTLADTKPLYGVPFTSKDNLKAKGFVTGLGNQYYIKGGSPATEDAKVVKRMRDAGAILIAISVLPNLAMSFACDDSGYGIANNPHDTRRIPGGSSSGEGIMIGAGASLCGIGNDIAGSIRIPANMNGIFGLKPTSFPDHVVPNEGLVPDNLYTYKPSANMLSNGPLCRYASDLPIALSILAGKNANSYALNVDFAKDFKLFYLEDINILHAQSLQPEQRNAVRQVKAYFEQTYNLTVQKVGFSLLSRMLELFYLDTWSPGIPTFNELKKDFCQIRAGVANSTFLRLGLEALKTFLAPKDDIEREFVAAKKAKLRTQMANLLGKNGVLLTPLWPTNVPFHHMEPFTFLNLKFTLMVNVLAFPALSAPTGKSASTNMPLGVQLIASPYNEALLIAVAQELERAFGGWVKPGQKPPH
uniref:Amidase domain-containing protein n=1 Tax=Globodera rostochiensis TaxID=31243 RepID=A0A914HKT9_GLORO